MGFTKTGRQLLVVLMIVLLSACGESDTAQTNANHLARADAYRDQGQYQAATIEYKNAIKKSNGDNSAFIQYAQMLNKLGHHSVALDLLEQAPGIEKSKVFYVVLVETYQGLKKYSSAEGIINEHLSEKDIEVRKLVAINYLGLTELEKARALYQSLLNENSKDNDAILGIATSLAREGAIDKSIVLLKTIDPKSEAHVKAQILIAGIYINQENLELAETTLSGLLSTMANTDIIEPEKAVVLERLSYVLTRQGRSNEAYIYTKLLAEAFPGSNEVKEKYQSAVQKLQGGELVASKAILTDILNDYPSYKLATQLLGVISYLEGDNSAASKYLSESVDPEVANELTRHIYAATNLKLNDPKKVIEILEPSIHKSKVPATLALYGLAAISDKQYAKGEAALLKALSIDENNVRIRLALAGYYRTSVNPKPENEWQQLKKSYAIDSSDKQVLKDIVGYHLRNNGLEKAQAFMDQALDKNKNDYATNLIAGYFSLNQNQIEKALGFFTIASNVKKEGEGYLNALFAKGKSEITLKRLVEAKHTFSEIVRVFPESELGYKGLLSVYLIDGKELEGQQKLEDYAQRNAHISPYLVLIQSAVAKQDVKAAKRFHEKAGALSGDDASLDRLGNAILYVEAVLAMKQQDFDHARKIVADILTNEPDNLRLLSFLVDLELRDKKINEATKVLKQIERVDPSHPIVALLNGEVALANKDLSSARTFFSEAWKVTPSDAAGDKLFKVLGQMKEKSALNQHLNDWLALFPNSQKAIMYQAVGFQQRGQRIKAIEGYEKLLKASPNNVMALNNLGWIYFEKSDDRALVLLKKAHDLAPESAAVLDSYGWVLVQNGQVKEGVVYLEKANKLAPKVQEIADHLSTAKGMK
jgi:predicted Zn-dependent protease